MPDWLISIPAFIVAIGVLVAVHEFGHFWVARRCGVKVLRYSIGFGQTLWSRTSPSTGTEYRIAMLPLGGYVKMLDEREGEVAEHERDQAFNRAPLHKRAAIVAAGPGINFAFAVLAYWLVFMLGVTGLKPVIGAVGPDTRAAEAGLVEGDEIVAVADDDVATWQGLRLNLLERALDQTPVRLTVREAGGDTRSVMLDLSRAPAEPAELFEHLGLSPYTPDATPIIADTVAGQAAARGGLQAGDRVLAANGEPLSSPRALVDWVRAHPGQSVALDIERDGRRMTQQLRLDSVASDSAPGDADSGEPIGRLGAHIGVDASQWDALQTQRRLNPLAAVPAAVSETWSVSALTVRLLWRMVVGDVSWKNISGPIQIADYAGKTASVGLEPFLSFLALISVSLAVLNLLPVPVLDGGHLLYYACEFVRGRPLSERVQAMGQQAGMVALLMLMSLAFYNDILRLFG